MPRPLARLLACLLLLSPLPLAAQTTVGPSGLPLPRFVSLAEPEVNMRAGPGREYPIRWIYNRRDLPVKIIEEYDVWRKIEDHEGDEGWVHSSLLSSRRTVVILGGIQDLHRTASGSSRVILRAEPGVVARLLDCQSDWCLVEIDERRGWVSRAAIWGVLDDEMRG
jgi:SH3-like domain-containing protein